MILANIKNNIAPDENFIVSSGVSMMDSETLVSADQLILNFKNKFCIRILSMFGYSMRTSQLDIR